MKKNINTSANRRAFLSSVVTKTAAVSLSTITSAISLQAKSVESFQEASPLDAWFNKIKGNHKMVFDATSANEGVQVIWPYTFMTTSNQMGTPDNELTALIVLRSKGICLAMDDNAWRKYKLGKIFKLNDFATNTYSERNLYWDPQDGEMPQPGMSIKDLQMRGALFCVCETALTLTSSQYARSKGMDSAVVKREWISALLPGIQLVPSGVWAINRAQEQGCTYCYAG